MDSKKFEAFLVSAETGSFTAAAQALGYTQAGITRIISALEDELGVTLFVRSKKGVALTSNGELLLSSVRDFVHAEQNIKQISAEINGLAQGVITVGSYNSFSYIFLPEVINEFNKQYPGIKVRTQEGSNLEMSNWLSEKSVDLCFLAKPKKTEFEWIPLLDDEIVAWIPKDHKLSRRENIELKTLETEPIIHIQPGEDTELDRMLEDNNIVPDVKYTTSNAFTAYNMVEAGLGISFNQRLISKKWNKTIEEIPFDPPQYVSLGIALPSLAEASPAALKFIEIVKSVI